jgi:NAD-dependent SIR2 family protein deacetylase
MSYTESESYLRDVNLRCVDCSETFTWSKGEQVYYRDRSLSQPKRCLYCRLRRRKRTVFSDSNLDNTLTKAKQELEK